MKRSPKTRYWIHAALTAALYAALSYLNQILVPGSAVGPVQFRAAEALCVLTLFTPAAVPGVTAGCLLFNVSSAGVLPADFLVGTLATALSALCMRGLRNRTVRGYPLWSMLMPVLFNGLIVGGELSVYMGGAFGLNVLTVALGELTVMLTLGSLLYWVLKKRGLDETLFS